MVPPQFAIDVLSNIFCSELWLILRFGGRVKSFDLRFTADTSTILFLTWILELFCDTAMFYMAFYVLVFQLRKVRDREIFCATGPKYWFDIERSDRKVRDRERIID